MLHAFHPERVSFMDHDNQNAPAASFLQVSLYNSDSRQALQPWGRAQLPTSIYFTGQTSTQWLVVVQAD